MTSSLQSRKAGRFLLAAAAIAVASAAHAAPGGGPRPGPGGPAGAAPAADVSSYPVAEGTVQRYLTTAFGEANALLLSDGRVASFPPHLSSAILSALPVGSSVRIFGRVAPYGQIHAYNLVNTASGATVLDQPPAPGTLNYSTLPQLPRHLAAQSLVPLQAEGTISLVLAGPAGDVRGVMLNTGVVVYLPRHAAFVGGVSLQVGAPFAASGLGTANAIGTALEALRVGANSGSLQPLYAGI